MWAAFGLPFEDYMEQLTFTEDEAKKLTGFVNFVFKKATWNNMTSAEVLETQRHFLFMQMFQKKVEDHIFEHLATIDNRTEEEKAEQ